MNPRLRRLQSDYEKIETRFANWPRVQVVETRGTPPEFYRIKYEVTGLSKQGDGKIVEIATHLLEINLSLQYPRRAPTCRMTTPIFHPNIDASSVCLGDFWASSEALDSLIIRIGRMIAFQEYNVKSPLDGIAARWAAENGHLLPVDTRPVEPPSMAVMETDQPISIMEDLLPPGDDNNDPVPPEKAVDGETREQAGGTTVPAENGGTVISLPGTLAFVNLQAHCRNCGCLMVLEAEHLAMEGFSCPQCGTYHALR